jgi:hypothetical protein
MLCASSGTAEAWPRRGGPPARGALEREPLAVRRRLQGDPAGVPLNRGPAQQPSPEPGQPPGISTVQHDLPDPADRPAVFTEHQAIMEQAMVHGMTHKPLRRAFIERCVIDVRACGARSAAVMRCCIGVQ